MTPSEHTVEANGLKHHIIVWEADGPTVLLAHGLLDIAWSWKLVAERLQAEGYRCVAWDWRGHGETEHIGAGGFYHFPDYVLDLEELLPQLRRGPDDAVHLVGHSMGGTAAAMFAGVRSRELRSLTLVEGLGPKTHDFDGTPLKFERWLDQMVQLRADVRTSPYPMQIPQALARMRVHNPELPEELGLMLAEKSTRPVPGGRAWRYDRKHWVTSPMPFRREIFDAFLGRIEVPTLVVMGERGFRLPDEKERYACLRRGRFVEIADVGHMIHWLAPQALADHIAAFIASGR